MTTRYDTIKRDAIMVEKLKIRTNDPQTIATGLLKIEEGGGESISFDVNVGLFKLSIVVQIPDEGEDKAPVNITWGSSGPQTTVMGHLKQGSVGELICFNVRLGLFELAFIVNIPETNATEAPLYTKWKMCPSSTASSNRTSGQTRADRDEVRED